MKNFRIKSIFAGKYFFFLVLLILILGRIAIVVPDFPRAGLDPSWAYGLSAATSSHLTFGRDIIHNFGPLSAIYTGFWAEEGHLMTVCLSMAAGLYLSFCVYKIFENAGYFIKLLLVIFFFVNFSVRSQDFLFSLIPALAALYLIRSYSCSKTYFVLVSLYGFITALLLLIKMSFGVEGFICLLLMFSFFMMKRAWKLCVALWAIFAVSFVILYIASGQPFSGIFYFPLNAFYGSSGYTDAMSFPSSTKPVIATAVFMAVFLCCFTYLSLKPFDLQKFFCVIVFALLLLINFKHSFIRNGQPSDAYLLLCFMLIYLLYYLEKSVIKNILITLCTFTILIFGTEDYRFFFKGPQITNSYLSLIYKATNADRIFSETKNNVNYENSLKAIRNASPMPHLEGTSDIYNFNQALLLASDNTWNPRPRFQSYQSVNQHDIRANYEHLINKDTAPDNVFFRVETIDGRIPSMDDGLSWKALLGLYKPYGWTENGAYLILKRDDSSDKELSVKSIKKMEGKINQKIVNPFENGLVFLKLHMRKSLPGKLVSVVYKTDPVWIRLQLENGKEIRFRIIPGMSETGFLLSPIVTSSMDFSKLYKSWYFADMVSGNGVKSISISPDSYYQYDDSFEVEFEQLEYPEKSKTIVYKLKKINARASETKIDPYVKFHLDSFNYKFVNNKTMSMDFSGWAFKKDVNIQKSSYSVIFSGHDGECFEAPLVNGFRPDINKHFNDGHNYGMSGYFADGLLDVSALKSKSEYDLYLRIVINGIEYVVPTNKVVPVS